jgi:hypothetical protein
VLIFTGVLAKALMKSPVQPQALKKGVMIALAFCEKPILYGLFFTQETIVSKSASLCLGVHCTIKAHESRDAKNVQRSGSKKALCKF